MTAVSPTVTTSRPSGSRSRLLRRKAVDGLFWGLGALALAAVVVPIVSILWGVVHNALAHWRWDVLTTNQVANGGGLLNAIEGTAVITFGVLVVGGIVGVAGGIYLAEYTAQGKGQFLRGASEVLAGVPSIVLGYVGYITLVVAFHWGFSLVAAVIVLSVLVIPYIMKTTEVAIRNVPTAYREGAEALGMRSGYVLRRLILQPALPGIMTGIIVAGAISVGETAPLLYTAGWSTHGPTFALTHSPVGYLTYAVFTFYNEPYASAHQLAASAALILMVVVLLLIVMARLVVSLSQRYSPERHERLRRSERAPGPTRQPEAVSPAAVPAPPIGSAPPGDVAPPAAGA
jgi:phosphate transport system permease protein